MKGFQDLVARMRKAQIEYNKNPTGGNLIYMDSMEEIFSLSLFQELKLRRIYRKHMKKVRKEQKRILKLRQEWEND